MPASTISSATSVDGVDTEEPGSGPAGLWIDRIDERGRSLATEVPASIYYHLVCALSQYLAGTAGEG